MGHVCNGHFSKEFTKCYTQVAGASLALEHDSFLARLCNTSAGIPLDTVACQRLSVQAMQLRTFTFELCDIAISMVTDNTLLSGAH